MNRHTNGHTSTANVSIWQHKILKAYIVLHP